VVVESIGDLGALPEHVVDQLAGGFLVENPVQADPDRFPVSQLLVDLDRAQTLADQEVGDFLHVVADLRHEPARRIAPREVQPVQPRLVRRRHVAFDPPDLEVVALALVEQRVFDQRADRIVLREDLELHCRQRILLDLHVGARLLELRLRGEGVGGALPHEGLERVRRVLVTPVFGPEYPALVGSDAMRIARAAARGAQRQQGAEQDRAADRPAAVMSSDSSQRILPPASRRRGHSVLPK